MNEIYSRFYGSLVFMSSRQIPCLKIKNGFTCFTSKYVWPFLFFFFIVEKDKSPQIFCIFWPMNEKPCQSKDTLRSDHIETILKKGFRLWINRFRTENDCFKLSSKLSRENWAENLSFCLVIAFSSNFKTFWKTIAVQRKSPSARNGYIENIRKAFCCCVSVCLYARMVRYMMLTEAKLF